MGCCVDGGLKACRTFSVPGRAIAEPDDYHLHRGIRRCTVGTTMFVRVLTFLAVLCFGQTLIAAKSKDTDVTKPNREAGSAPVVFPPKKAISVVRGQTVEIELTGTTSSTGSMTFVIRSQPQLGTLSGKPKAKTKLTAVVSYTASPDTKGDKDKFTFAAQVPGSSMSEPATVTINITDAAPKLDFPPLVDAGRLVLGNPGVKEFVIRNTGNAPWDSKIAAPKGWRWVAPEGGVFRVAPGGEVRCEIHCEAHELTTLEESVALSVDGSIRFTARIVPPFTLLPKQLVLKWKDQTRSRDGLIEVQNLDPERALTLKVDGPEWLTVPGSLSMEADKKAELPLSVAGLFDQPLNGVVTLSVGAYSQRVEVRADPGPALLTIVPGDGEETGIHFGKLTAETLPNARRSVTVRNDGGTAAALTVEVPNHFRMATPLPAEGINVAPGADAAFVVLPPTDTAGTFRGDFVVTGGGSRAAVEFTAGIELSALKVTPGRKAEGNLNQSIRPATGVRPARTEEHKRLITRSNRDGFWISDGAEDPKLPRISVVDVEKDTGDSITVAWDLPEGDGWKFKLYYSRLDRLKTAGYGDLVMVWTPCGDDVTYATSGRRASATVTNLVPLSPFKFCIQTIAADGRRSPPGKPIIYTPTIPTPTHWQKYWDWYVAGLVGLISLGYWLRKKWKEPISGVTA